MVELNDMLQLLWYLVAGIIAAIPIYFLLDCPSLCPMLKLDGVIALALITVLGYVIHQVFRWATFNHYFSERPFNDFFRRWLSKRARTLSKRIEKVDGEVIDAIYTQLIFSNSDFKDRFDYVKRKSTFSTSVGVARFAFFIGSLAFLIGLAFSVWRGNMSLFLLHLMLFFIYFVLFMIFHKHYQNLEKSINLHEKALVLLNKDEVKIDEKKLEELLNELDNEKNSESYTVKFLKTIRCIIFGL